MMVAHPVNPSALLIVGHSGMELIISTIKVNKFYISPAITGVMYW